VKQHYPFRFNLYCPACAARYGANVKLELHRQPRTFLRPESYRLTVARAEISRRSVLQSL
jgi:hypothetical protein